ncbi:MAG: glycosyltransferase family 39 protein [Lewinellaceae bacterium]|nr:glycosyltransferase family 39 protein [Saprospiraceae bacterium]MCB9315785.1 glycosyltransferase family 39 protein [Lewinellaceae bacterium]MCB9332460.1 glycosyltransferase family 39 protein [Lewinellaceae bacterium]
MATPAAFTRQERLLLAALVALKLLLHFFTNTQYGFHRDEFLYLDEGNHLGWGFLEVPPLTPLVGKVAVTFFGDSLFSVRLFSALAGAGVVLLIGLMIREMGGKRWAIAFGGLAFILSPSFLRTGTLFQPVGFEHFFWTLCAYILVRTANRGWTGNWYWLGIAAGLAWMNKYSIGFFGLALLLGIALTRQRKLLADRRAWMALGIAFLIAIPNLLWQWQHEFPVVHHMTELAQTQLVHVESAGFLMDQLMMQFVGFVVWVPGLLWLLFSKPGQPFRFLGFAFLILLALLLLLSGKSYYSLGAYPMLMAAGGVALGHFFENKNRVWPGLLLGWLVLTDLLILPLGLPVLPIEQMEKYCDRLAKYGEEQRWEDGNIHPIPQDYADMFGWEETAATVAEKYHSLPAEKQATCLIYGGSYVHAGLLNYYRKKYGLPEAVSLNSSYVLWAPDSLHFDNMILVDDTWQDSSTYFKHQVFVDSVQYRYARDPGYVFYRYGPRAHLDSLVTVRVRAAKRAVGE